MISIPVKRVSSTYSKNCMGDMMVCRRKNRKSFYSTAIILNYESCITETQIERRFVSVGLSCIKVPRPSHDYAQTPWSATVIIFAWRCNMYTVFSIFQFKLFKNKIASWGRLVYYRLPVHLNLSLLNVSFTKSRYFDILFKEIFIFPRTSRIVSLSRENFCLVRFNCFFTEHNKYYLS